MIKLVYPPVGIVVLDTDNPRGYLLHHFELYRLRSYHKLNIDMPFCTGTYWMYVFTVNIIQEAII